MLKLKCVNIVSKDPKKLAEFYSLVFGVPANELVPGRWELPVEDVTLVFTYTSGEVTVPPDSCGLEFLCDDVDREYARLTAAGVRIPEPPVTYPWGWRAIGFKDPDGNHVDFVHDASN